MTGRKKRDNIHPSSERMEAITSGGNQSKQQFKPGDTTWIKLHGNSWWPAQIVDEKTVGNKPKKKANDEILVRKYGTYEYLYMNPWKSSSEFEKFLEQQNCNSGEAFQKSLEEDLLHLKSASKSKREVSKSEENSTVEAPKCKKQKADKIQRNREAIGPVSVIGNAQGEAFKHRCAEQGELRKNMIEKAKCGTSKVQNTNQNVSRKMKLKDAKEQVKLMVRDELSEEKCMKQCDASSQKVRVKVINETSTRKTIKQHIFRNRKQKDVKNQVIEEAQNKVSDDKSNGQSEEGRQDGARKAVNGCSKVEMMKHDCSRKLKRKYDTEERTEMEGFKIPKHKTKQSKEGRSGVMQNATDRVSEVKNVKQMGSSPPKHDDTKEHTESPGLTKYGTPQERGDLSARRTRVMQSLGLIAPLGSPFRRNGLVEAAVLKL